MSTFVAIDFETATTRRDSACAVGLAAGCNGRVVLARTYLIRPPTAQFTFTDLHGLDCKDVHDAPTFAELWPTRRSSPPTTRRSTGASCIPNTRQPRGHNGPHVPQRARARQPGSPAGRQRQHKAHREVFE